MAPVFQPRWLISPLINISLINHFIDSLPAVVHKILNATFFCLFSQQIPDEFDKGEFFPDSKLVADCVHRLCCRALCVWSLLCVCLFVVYWMSGWFSVTIEPAQAFADGCWQYLGVEMS